MRVSLRSKALFRSSSLVRPFPKRSSSQSLRGVLTRTLVRNSPPDWSNTEIMKNLASNYSILHDQKDKYSQCRMETLLDADERSYKVKILTLPFKDMFTSKEILLETFELLKDAQVVFNFDPSKTIQMDRKLLHLPKDIKIKTVSKKLKYSVNEEGFVDNIYGLEFPGECIHNSDIMKRLFVKSWSENKFEGKTDDLRNHLKQLYVMDKDRTYMNLNVETIFDYIIFNSNSESEQNQQIGFVGMPELLFRAQFSRLITTGSILSDFMNFYGLLESQRFFQKNKKANKSATQNYLFNDPISSQDSIMKSSFHFNSLFYRCCYTLELVKKLSKNIQNLVIVADPLTTFHLKEILQKQSHFSESQLRK